MAEIIALGVLIIAGIFVVGYLLAWAFIVSFWLSFWRGPKLKAERATYQREIK